MAAAGLILYAAVKPELDKCREIAYDKLAQMDVPIFPCCPIQYLDKTENRSV